MHASLTVIKTDGSRETLDAATMEMARTVFEKLDWDSELAAVAATPAPGAAQTPTFSPEFVLTDDSERSLAVFPVDAATVSISLQTPADLKWRRSYPKGEVSHLIGLYYEGFDDDIAAIIAQAPAVCEVPVRELSEAEFRATIRKPMFRLPVDEGYRQVPLRDYLHSCILKYNLPVTLNSIELTDIYLAAGKKHSHIHFQYADADPLLVIVVQHEPDPDFDFIAGHFYMADPADYYAM
jgi:hypothetical protein